MLTRMNPNVLSLSKNDPIYSAKWIKWLVKDKGRGEVYLKELKSLESQYWIKRGEIEKIMLGLAKDPGIREMIKNSKIRALAK